MQKINLLTRTKRRRLLTVLDKMVAWELFKTALSVLTVIVIILVSKKFVKVLSQAIEGQISSDAVIKIVGYKALGIGISFLPAAIFIAVLVVLGRMYRDHEIDAIASGGAGLARIYQSIAIFLIPVSVVSLCLSLFSTPWAESNIVEIKHQDQQQFELRGLISGSFRQRGDLMFFIEDIDDNNRMHNIFATNHRTKNIEVINAEYGQLEDLPGGRYIVLQDAERVSGKPGQVDVVIERFDKYALLIKKDNKLPRYHIEALSTKTLLNGSSLRNSAELQRRLAVPLGILMLGLLAVPLAQLTPRGGVYGNVIVAFLIYFSYANLQKFSQGWLLKGVLPLWFSLTWVYGLMFLVWLLLLLRFFGLPWIKVIFRQRFAE
ncbi:MAG TPA: LPS export ABC transporter permease LptF [Methylococcaceae bacterium]|nr:LPS export ABC transporter permease LptF [Methylococcaceae bacterium]HIN69358.1 LPS export ABC transporter permease LptF [Methylococcales bacterium]HIA46346.1 LPS export ABC transporter permease LptF [Methylococcaceae bacterium]HIB63313.1 LPS export ABC transporter permease LptF [Methylococcaceae bacterium]HIO12406.1 LPS export ABC transporter permease LptF [Methylococcales bacterium]